jgi:cytochrome c oxidase assembly protein subunit 15
MDAEKRLLWFRRLALAGALFAACVVVLGAWVRLTDAGLGCPDWPGCYGHVYPDGATANFSKAMHEMIHRYFASTLGLIIICLLITAFLNRRLGRQPLVAVAMLFMIVCAQGALGALTVTLLLKPAIVTAHLLGGLTTLGILWWLALTPERRELSESEAALRKFALLGFVVLVAQIALGGWTSTNYAAVACPDLPTCQRSWWPHMDFRDAFVLWRGLDIDYTGGILTNAARVAIHVTHRVGALVAAVVLFGVGMLTFARARSRRLRIAGLLVAGAVILQICIGVAMVHLSVPLPVATMHNAGAALLVICVVTLLRMLWPGAASGVVPLNRADRPR